MTEKFKSLYAWAQRYKTHGPDQPVFEAILESPEGLTIFDICQKTGQNERSVRNSLVPLVDTRLVTKFSIPGRGNIVYLKPNLDTLYKYHKLCDACNGCDPRLIALALRDQDTYEVFRIAISHFVTIQEIEMYCTGEPHRKYEIRRRLTGSGLFNWLPHAESGEMYLKPAQDHEKILAAVNEFYDNILK